MALTASGKLVNFMPGTNLASLPKSVLGLRTGETLVGIDYRPATGTLIGVGRVGNDGQLYTINTTTGEAQALTRSISSPALTLAATQYGVDFNPVPGALRIVGDNEENYRITFAGSTYTVITDTALNPAGNVVAAAYTNSFAGTPVTTLYDLDSTGGNLVVQGGIDSATNPNSGVITNIGSLGVAFTNQASLDVDGVTGVALATLNLASAQSTGVYAVNLGTGVASCVGTVNAPTGDLITGLAIPTPTPAVAYGLTEADQLVSFTPNAAGVATVSAPVAISGIGAGETPMGIDFRPRSGALTLVTRDTNNLGRVYEVDPVSGVATLVPVRLNRAGVTPETANPLFSFAVGATGFGVDFNPVPNALRVISDTEENFRLTFPAAASATGVYDVFIDGAINPVGSATSAAYTNNFDGTTGTRLYAVDTASSQLKYQNPPNDGAQVVVGSLGITVAGASGGLDIIGGAGVNAAVPADIGTNIGNTVTFAALSVGGNTNLYRINLQTGAATQIGAVPVGGTSPVALKGLAVRVRK